MGRRFRDDHAAAAPVAVHTSPLVALGRSAPRSFQPCETTQKLPAEREVITFPVTPDAPVNRRRPLTVSGPARPSATRPKSRFLMRGADGGEGSAGRPDSRACALDTDPLVTLLRVRAANVQSLRRVTAWPTRAARSPTPARRPGRRSAWRPGNPRARRRECSKTPGGCGRSAGTTNSAPAP